MSYETTCSTFFSRLPVRSWIMDKAQERMRGCIAPMASALHRFQEKVLFLFCRKQSWKQAPIHLECLYYQLSINPCQLWHTPSCAHGFLLACVVLFSITNLLLVTQCVQRHLWEPLSVKPVYNQKWGEPFSIVNCTSSRFFYIWEFLYGWRRLMCTHASLCCLCLPPLKHNQCHALFISQYMSVQMKEGGGLEATLAFGEESCSSLRLHLCHWCVWRQV